MLIHFSFFASFRLLASNFSLRFTLVIFETKGSEIQVYFLLFFTFLLFFAFFCFFCFFSFFFRFKFFASLRFSNFCFEAKQSEAKYNSIFSFFFHFFHFFTFFAFFHLIFVSLRFFHLIFAYFTFVFASDFWCFASK
jgi:hypothetical protein